MTEKYNSGDFFFHSTCNMVNIGGSRMGGGGGCKRGKLVAPLQLGDSYK